MHSKMPIPPMKQKEVSPANGVSGKCSLKPWISRMIPSASIKPPANGNTAANFLGHIASSKKPMPMNVNTLEAILSQ